MLDGRLPGGSSARVDYSTSRRGALVILEHREIHAYNFWADQCVAAPLSPQMEAAEQISGSICVKIRLATVRVPHIPTGSFHFGTTQFLSLGPQSISANQWMRQPFTGPP